MKSGVIKVTANLTITASMEISLFKDDTCNPSNIQIDGEINGTTSQSFTVSYSGLV